MSRRVLTAFATPGLALLLVFGSIAGPSAADVQAATGRLVALLVVDPTSDSYPLYHGAISVGDSIGGFTTYHWGGSFCPGKDLLEPSVAALHRALDDPRVVVQPFTKNGQGGALCVVAVRYILRNEQGMFP
jgi:hypothetical protein